MLLMAKVAMMIWQEVAEMILLMVGRAMTLLTGMTGMIS